MTDPATSTNSVLPVSVLAEDESLLRKRDPPGRESDTPNRELSLRADNEIVEEDADTKEAAADEAAADEAAADEADATKVVANEGIPEDLNVENVVTEPEMASQEKTTMSVDEAPAADNVDAKPPPAEESPIPDSQPAPPVVEPVIAPKEVPTKKPKEITKNDRPPSKIKRSRIVAAKTILASPSPLRKRPARKSVGGLYPKPTSVPTKSKPAKKATKAKDKPVTKAKDKPATKAKDNKVSKESKASEIKRTTNKTASGKAPPPKKKTNSAKKSASATSAAKTKAVSTEVYRGPPEDAFVDGSDKWPRGWILTKVKRQSGATIGREDRYWYSPVTKKKFRSKAEILRFVQALKKTGGDEGQAFKAM